MIGTLVLFRFTNLGLRMRASAFARETARLLGVRVGLMLTLGWGLAGIAGSLAGLLVAPTSSFGPYYMDLILVYGFTAAVIGGLESPVGALVGGLITGLCVSYVGGYLGVGTRAARGAGPADGGSHGPARRHLLPPAGPEGLSAVASRDILRTVHVPRQPMVRHLLVALVAAAVFYIVTGRFSAYNDYQVGEIASYVVALVGLSLLTGVNGQISLGNGAFMAVGAYTMGLLMTHTATNFVLELLAAAALAAAAGVVIGLPATRLKGPYLAGMTLLFALAVPSIADKWSGTFGGDQGLTTIVPTAPGSLGPEEWLAWIQIGAALIVMVLVANLLSSRYGRSFRAVRDDEIAASLTGIHVARTKVMAFAISAACAGLGGALLSLSTGVVNTGEFPLTLSIQLLAAMVIGGTGTLIGMVWGGILLVYTPQWSTSLSSDFNLGSGVSAYLATIIFGAVLIAAMIAAPNGIQGGLRWVWGQVRHLLRRRSGAARPLPASAGD